MRTFRSLEESQITGRLMSLVGGAWAHSFYNGHLDIHGGTAIKPLMSDDGMANY